MFLGEFFILFASMETYMNTLQKSYKIHHFTLTVSSHYLAKLRTTENELNIPVKLMRSYLMTTFSNKCLLLKLQKQQAHVA